MTTNPPGPLEIRELADLCTQILQEVEYYQAIDEVLTLMETTLEMTHDRESS